jgi:hypothetical protein
VNSCCRNGQDREKGGGQCDLANGFGSFRHIDVNHKKPHPGFLAAICALVISRGWKGVGIVNYPIGVIIVMDERVSWPKPDSTLDLSPYVPSLVRPMHSTRVAAMGHFVTASKGGSSPPIHNADSLLLCLDVIPGFNRARTKNRTAERCFA